GAGVHAPADAGVLAFGVFAHDVHVDFARLAGTAVAAHHRRDDPRHQSGRPQVDVLVELAPEQQQRTPQRHMVRYFFGPADGAEVDRVVTANLVLPVVRHHLAVLLAVVPARKIEAIELEIDPELVRHRFHHANAFGHYFLADAVTGDHC